MKNHANKYIFSTVLMFLALYAFSIVSMRALTVYADVLPEPTPATEAAVVDNNVDEAAVKNTDWVETVCNRSVDGEHWITVWECGENAFHEWTGSGVLYKPEGPDAGHYEVARAFTAGSLAEVEADAETYAVENDAHVFIICTANGDGYDCVIFRT